MPDAIALGPFLVRTFAGALVIAALAALWLSGPLARRAGLDDQWPERVLLLSLIAGVLAARGAHVIAQWPAYGDRPWSLDAIERYAAEGLSPLDGFYRATFDGFDDINVPRVDLADVDFVGISVVFPSQIPEAFYLCRAIRERG